MSDRRQLLQESLATIERLEARLAASDAARREPIAIVGAGCRFPGSVETPDELWRLLAAGRDAVDNVPSDRWDADAYYDPDPAAPGKMVTRRGGFLKQVDRFEPQFFGISPREAKAIDPQQRLLLETTYEALESAGIATDALAGSLTGVFVGITTSDYGQLSSRGGSESSDFYTATGSALNAAAGRISFTFGFQGPCVAVDTACSSSLVAVHLACQSLRAGESNLAVAGGVNVILSPDAMVLFSKWGMMAPDGACKTFDAAADGFVRAEGCAMIALRRLSDAVAAGDPILAIIRGSAVNSDGRSSGLTVPNGPAQQAVIRTALASAGLNGADIDYVEAHGTGTSLGDPIEVEALGQVLSAGRPPTMPLRIGSIKTNLGHTEAASGLTGLLKVVLALQHEAIPAHLHFREPNPGIPWAELPIVVNTTLTPWPRSPRPRRAGVSSFGFSGTNAHVIVEEAPAAPTTAPTTVDPTGDPVPILISARDEAALRGTAARLADFVASDQAIALDDIAATLTLGRNHHAHRWAILADSTDQMLRDLRELAGGATVADAVHGVIRPGERAKIAFLFTGQGSQYPGMGRALYESQPVFRATIDRAARVLVPLLDRPLLDVLFGADARVLSHTAYTQPALFALEVALADLWRSWGVTPAIVAGHSVGEYAAACVAGVFSLEEGVALIAERARLMGALPEGGAMAAVFASEGRVAERIAPWPRRLAIAAINGLEETVVSGDADAVEEVMASFAAEGVTCRRLDVSHAFHSPRLEPMLDAFERRAAATPHAAPRLPLVSNVTGATFTGTAAPDAHYWRRHAREAVRFSQCLETLRASGVTTLLEIGPHPTLVSLASRVDSATWSAVASLRRGRDDRREMLSAATKLHVRGAAIAWDAVLANRGHRRSLPTYPFQRQRYWLDRVPPAITAAAVPRMHPLLGSPLVSPLTIFANRIDLTTDAWLADHRIFEFTLFPGTGFLELMWAAGRQILRGAAVEVGALAIREALPVPADGSVQLQVIARPAGDGHVIEVYSRASDLAGTAGSVDQPWRFHASGEVRAATPGAEVSAAGPLATLRDRSMDAVDVAAYYEMLTRQGADYGPTFRVVREIRQAGSDVLGRVQMDRTHTGHAAEFGLHPGLLDACLQLVGAGLEAVGGPPPSGDELCVPVAVDTYRLHHPGRAEAWCHAQVTRASEDLQSFYADLTLFDADGTCIAEVRGLGLRRTLRATMQRLLAGSAGAPEWLFETTWVAQPLPVANPDAGHAPGHTGTSGTWLLQASPDGVAAAVADLLGARGAGAAITIHAGNRSSFEGDIWQMDLADPVAWREALAEGRRRGGGQLAGVVLAGGIDVPFPASDRESPSDIEAIERAQMTLIATVLAASKALAESDVRVWVVTRGAQAAGDVAPDLVQAPVWAVAGVMATELAAQKVVRIDLDGDGGDVAREAAALADHLLQPDGEDRIALRGAQRLVARLTPSSAEPRLPETPLCLQITERGTLSNLRLVDVPRPAPGPGELEIRVHATGLNFRDVLNALGMYPGDPGPLGNECAGVVTAIGEGVQGFCVGDEVVTLVDRSFATWVLARAALTVKKPVGMEFAAAATVPVTFLTALYALRELSQIKPGDRVLIHAVTGGVGMAALQLALRAGAIVYGTAGTPAKRALASRLGVHHVGDSRSLSFVEEFRRAGIGEGIDIVLNSLAGDFIPATLGLLRPGGHFVEIGKIGIWDAATVAEAFPGRHYHALYLGEIAATRPDYLRGLLDELFADMQGGTLRALPAHCWPLDDAEAAFRFMGQGHHTGKIVITQSPAPSIRPDVSYLVTGGFGGLGLACAAGLADAGARHLVLLGRRAPSGAAVQAIDALRQRGVNVTEVFADVADADALARALGHLLPSGGGQPATGAPTAPPLRGILHTAGVLDDGVLAELTPERFLAVMAPKVRGTWNLHALTATTPLDFFVAFSSGSAVFGSPGQGNYAAANAFMDALASRRRLAGRHGLSINWGSWAGVGMAASIDESHHRRWAALGASMIEPRAGVDMLLQLIRANRHAVAVALPLHRAHLRSDLPPFYALLRPAAPAGHAAPGDVRPVDLRQRLLAVDDDARRELLQAFLATQVVTVLALGGGYHVDPQRSLVDLGMDSLMAMELRNRVQAATGLRLAVTDLLQGATVHTLAVELAVHVDAGSAVSGAPVSDAITTPAVSADAGWEEGTL